MSKLPIFGYTNFNPETRVELVEKIFGRMSTIYSNWLYGEYKDASLRDCIECDPEVRDMQGLHWCLWCHFTGDYSGVGYYCPDAHDWLAEKLESATWPTRATRVVGTNNIVVSLFQRAGSVCAFSMHGPSGEVEHVGELMTVAVEHVIEPMTERAPRKSARNKKQREFYYGF